MTGMEFHRQWHKLLPHLPPMMDARMLRCGIVTVDVLKLDAWLIQNAGYVEDGKTSMADFIEKRYGKAAVEFLAALLKVEVDERGEDTGPA